MLVIWQELNLFNLICLLLTAKTGGKYPCLTDKNCPKFARCEEYKCVCRQELTGDGENCVLRKNYLIIYALIAVHNFAISQSAAVSISCDIKSITQADMDAISRSLQWIWVRYKYVIVVFLVLFGHISGLFGLVVSQRPQLSLDTYEMRLDAWMIAMRLFTDVDWIKDYNSGCVFSSFTATCIGC